MSLQFKCPNCNTLLSTSTDKSGSIVNCGRCHKDLLVPQSVPPVATPAVEPIEFQPTNQAAVDRHTISEYEPQPVPPFLAQGKTTEQTGLQGVHRPWFRDPIIVFGWLLPLYFLAGFVIWVGMDLRTKWVLSRRNTGASERLVQAPVDLEAETKVKTQPRDSKKFPPPATVLPEKPAPPVATASADDNSNR